MEACIEASTSSTEASTASTEASDTSLEASTASIDVVVYFRGSFFHGSFRGGGSNFHGKSRVLPGNLSPSMWEQRPWKLRASSMETRASFDGND